MTLRGGFRGKPPLLFQWFVFIAFGLVFAQPLAADTVQLLDGSLIFGKVASIGAGSLSLKTSYAGDLNIPLKGVKAIWTEDEHTITLEGSVVHTGRLEFTSGQQKILGEDGPISLEITGIAKSVPAPLPDESRIPADWSGRAELSLNGDTGNTNRFSLRTRVSATRTSTLDRLTLSLRAEFEESDGVRETAEVAGRLHHEHDLSERRYFFTRLDTERDDFESVEFRARIVAGLGRFLIKSPRQELKILGGGGYEYERFSDGSEANTGLVGAGYEYRVQARNWLRFDSSLITLMSITDIGDWRLQAVNGAELPLSNRAGWKLRLGVRNEYDAEPLPGVESLDTNYYLSIVYDWD